MFQKIKASVYRIAPVTAAGVAVAGSAHAAGTDTITPLFAALDVTTLATNISTLMLAGVGVALLFLGYRYVKKGGRVF